MILNENSFPTEEEMIEDALENNIENNGMASLLISAINSNWDLIQEYNDILVNTIDDSISSIISDVVEDSYENIGKLQTALDIVAPHVDKIEQGQQEAREEQAGVNESLNRRGFIRKR